MHRARLTRTGTFEKKTIKTTLQRLFSKTKQEGPVGCWSHGYKPNYFGYARIRYRETKVLAHRFVYEQFYGPVPEGLLVLHHCNNPKCVNPHHLYAGTHSDNVQDALRAGTHANGHGKTKQQIKCPECGGNGLRYSKPDGLIYCWACKWESPYLKDSDIIKWWWQQRGRK